MKLEEFRKLMEASTPGPWVYDSYSSVVGAYPGYDPHVLASVPVIAGDTATPDGANDAAFIAAMRSMAPKFLALAEAVKCNPHPEPQAGCPICKALAALEEETP